MFTRVREDGLLAPGRPVVVLLSGGRDSTCLLDLAVRVAGASAVTALHVNYGIRESAGEDDRHCHELCASLGVGLGVRRPPGPPSSGNVQAWAREVRYREALELAPAAATWPPATRGPIRSRRSSTGWRPRRAGGRCSGCGPREGSLVRPLLGFTREETAAYCLERGLRWREDESNASPAYARNRIRAEAGAGAARRPPRGARTTCSRWRGSCARRARCSTRSSTSVLGPRIAVSLSVLRSLPPALRRLVVQRLADDAAAASPRARAAAPRRSRR